jgi:type II secretory pathway pseudopilin PulG
MHYLKRLISKESGLGLLEIILVISILTVGMLTIMRSFRTGIKSSVGSETLSLATQLAEEKMEEIKSDKESSGFSFLHNSAYPGETDPEGFIGFIRSVQISNVSDYKLVQVTVTHQDVPNVVLTTVYENY